MTTDGNTYCNCVEYFARNYLSFVEVISAEYLGSAEHSLRNIGRAAGGLRMVTWCFSSEKARTKSTERSDGVDNEC